MERTTSCLLASKCKTTSWQFLYKCKTIAHAITTNKKMYTIVSILLCIFIMSCCAQQPLPAVLPQTTIEGTSNGECPATNVIEQERNNTKSAIRSMLHDTVVPELNRRYSNQPQCPCGGPGRWTKIAYLNMSDPSQQCPSSWRLTTAPVRGCGRLLTAAHTCGSTIFPSGGRSYSRVCGRINAYQKGSPNAVLQEM